MAERLTDRPSLNLPAAGNDLIHIVDVSDTTDNAAGSSVKQTVGLFLAGKTFGKNVQLPNTKANALIFNMSNTANHPTNQALENDFVVFIDAVLDLMIIGVAIDNCSTVPADLEDGAKFVKFYEGNKLL
jgi:hypothetical protein